MKTASPLGQGGTSGGFRSGLSSRPSQTGHDNPLKASRPLSFRLLSPFVKGDFQGSFPGQRSIQRVHGSASPLTLTSANPKAHAACIERHGHSCAVCGFDFARVYGTLGEGFIHVHHVVPIGKIGERYQIDPMADLIPVCPNCHAMIHRTEPPLTVEQLRNHIHERGNCT